MIAVIDYVCAIGAHSTAELRTAELYTKTECTVSICKSVPYCTVCWKELQKFLGFRHIPKVEVYVDMEDLTYKDLIVAMGIKRH